MLTLFSYPMLFSRRPPSARPMNPLPQAIAFADAADAVVDALDDDDDDDDFPEMMRRLDEPLWSFGPELMLEKTLMSFACRQPFF